MTELNPNSTTDRVSRGEASQQKPLWRELAHVLVPVGILLAGGIVAYLFWSTKTPPERVDQESPIPLVETVAIESHDEGVVLDIDGVVVPYREVSLAAQVSGRILTKTDVCNAGKYVTKGTLLLEIDPTDYQLNVDRLKQEVLQAQNSLTELQLQIDNRRDVIDLAKREVELQRAETARIEQLHKEGYTSDTEYDAARRQLVVVETAVLKLENDLEVAEASEARITSQRDLAKIQLQQAEVDLERTKIHSPVDGVVITDDVEEDWFVNIGTPLATIEDTSRVEVRCKLQADELYWLWHQVPGSVAPSLDMTADASPAVATGYEIPRVKVTVIYEVAGREFAWDGVLDRYDGVGLDESTRTIPCRVVVEAPRKARIIGSSDAHGKIVMPPALVRGMFVTLRIHARPDVKLAEIPERALQPNNTLLLAKDGKLAIQPVQVVAMDNGDVIIRAEADDTSLVGMKAVISPLPTAYEGMPIREDSNNTDKTPEEPSAGPNT